MGQAARRETLLGLGLEAVCNANHTLLRRVRRPMELCSPGRGALASDGRSLPDARGHGETSGIPKLFRGYSEPPLASVQDVPRGCSRRNRTVPVAGNRSPMERPHALSQFNGEAMEHQKPIATNWSMLHRS